MDDEAALENNVRQLYATSSGLCFFLAQNLNDTSRLDYNEFGVDIAQFDRDFGVKDHPALEDPLRASHDLITGYLRSAGELLHAIGSLLAIPSEWVVSPGVLARSVAIHSAYAYRISDPYISALERCNLSLNVAKKAWLPDTKARKSLVADIDRWISVHGLGKPKDITQEERLIASMFDEEIAEHNSNRQPGQRKFSILQDDNFYARLSRLVHGDTTTLMSSLLMAYVHPVANNIYVMFDVLTGLVTAYKTGNRVNDIRGGQIENYDEIYYVIVDLVTGFRDARSTAECLFKMRFNG
ncbi:hypothetical protein BKG80_18970 [Mycobacteroides chelonae]|uniref:hypothetical protein n=1 Tax=Mycobacteroides chelonae TaxID=1774 RepID=UPI0008AA18E4|nr:hypothetical protein [Mycobacteroides chelonae]MBF9349275.1 hypothetical protein [Mycobacteroides chelonae]OHU34970.1 hypothetical protein BKG80_18970 [Mycobacteroides chelonae]